MRLFVGMRDVELDSGFKIGTSLLTYFLAIGQGERGLIVLVGPQDEDILCV